VDQLEEARASRRDSLRQQDKTQELKQNILDVQQENEVIFLIIEIL